MVHRGLSFREFQRFLFVLIGVAHLVSAAQAQLTHRYSFTANGNDSVGSANWTANGGASFSGGQVNFDGVDDFLSLATNPLPTAAGSSATIEVWGTYDPSTAAGSRIFDFATANGDFYFYGSTNAATGGTRVGWDDDFNAEIGPESSAVANTGQEVLLTIVLDVAGNTFRLYKDGAQINQVTAEGLQLLQFISGVNTNRLGHGVSDTVASNAVGQENPPAFLLGSINEFRIHNGALTPVQVLTNAVSGPDITSVSLTTNNFTAGSGSWGTESNWSAGVPAVGHRATISSGGTVTATSALPQAGALSLTSGTVTVGAGGSLDIKYPIELSPNTTVNVNGGGQLALSGILPVGAAGARTLNVDNGTLRVGAGSAVVDVAITANIGAGGASVDTNGGIVSWLAPLAGAGDITVSGGGTLFLQANAAVLPGMQNPNYSGNFHVSNSTVDVSGTHGAFGTGSARAGSTVNMNNSTLVINTGSSLDAKRVPADFNVTGDNVWINNNVNVGQEVLLQGSIGGSGTIRFDVPLNTNAQGLDFVDRPNALDATNPFTSDNSGFTGRFIVNDDTATRFFSTPMRDEFGNVILDELGMPVGYDRLSDFPNAVFELAGDGAWAGKRGTDPNQVIQFGGLEGVGPDLDLQMSSGGTAGFGSRLQASIAAEGDPGGFTAVTYEIGGVSEDTEFFGIIRDTPFTGGHDVVTVVKVGDNTQAFNGNNSYSGTTTVNGGTLLINGSHAQAVVDGGVSANDPANYDGLPVGDYTVNAGGTLGGTGTIGSATDQVNVNVAGGTLAPGASPGTLTINGNYAQDSSSTLAIEIGGTPGSGLFDLLSVSGSASLAGALSVSLVNSPALNVGDMFTVLSAGSVTGGGGLTLSGPAASSFELNATSNSLVLEFIGGGVIDVDLDNDGDVDGRDFLLIQRTDPSLISAWEQQYGTGILQGNLTAVPEPSSLWLVASVCLAAMARRNDE